MLDTFFHFLRQQNFSTFMFYKLTFIVSLSEATIAENSAGAANNACTRRVDYLLNCTLDVLEV